MTAPDTKSGEPRQIIALRGFYTDERVIANIGKLASDIGGRCDFVFFYDKKPARVDPDRLPPAVPCVGFDQDNWVKYKQPDPYNRTFIPGNEETMFLMFQEDFPGYDYYWFIEYDVEYTGDWWDIFENFRHSDADLLATSLIAYEDYPGWGIWKSLTPPPDSSIPDQDKVRSFLPVCRFSHRALKELRDKLAEGWSGHPEALVATLFKRAGLKLEDIGGDGKYVKPENINRYYRNNLLDPDLAPGTFVFRPKMPEPGDTPDTLWHPIKPHDVAVWDTPPGLLTRWKFRLGRLADRLKGGGVRG